MKKIQSLVIALGMGLMFSACHNRHHLTIIATENNQTKMRIEYAGRIIFNDEQTAILDISKDGYFKYERGNEKLDAEGDGKGHVTYRLNDGEKSQMLTDEGRQLLGEAIRQINKNRLKHKG